jgi:hypothetical protein
MSTTVVLIVENLYVNNASSVKIVQSVNQNTCANNLLTVGLSISGNKKEIFLSSSVITAQTSSSSKTEKSTKKYVNK